MLDKYHNDTFSAVWVEVGRPIGKYAKNNMKLMVEMFPNLKQYLVSDRAISLDFVEIIDTKTVPTSERTKQFLEQKKIWPHKQQYFWLGTTSRFFHLYDAMKFHGLQNVLHLETDSVLLAETPIQDFFKRDGNFELAFPLQSSDLGCASIMLIRSAKSLEKFLDHILKNWSRSEANDMTLLGEYSVSQEVKILSTWPSGEKEEYFYDAGTIGRFFLGSDSRNFRFPFSIRGIVEDRQGSIVKRLEKECYKWKVKRKDSTLLVELEYQEVRSSLVNIHIHSKSVPRSLRILTLLLRLGFGPRIPVVWKIGIFDKVVFAERLVSFIQRRLLRNEDFQDKSLR